MSMTVPHRFRLGSLSVASEFVLSALPPLPPGGGAGGEGADVVIRAGTVPESLNGAMVRRGILMEADGDGALLLRVPRVARFLVRGGDKVLVDKADGASDLDVAAHLMGVVQTALWHQRGFLPLHASVVTIRGRAVALAGISTAGKSTLAAALSARGHGILADDACVIDFRDGMPVVWPTVGVIRLWPDSVRRLGGDPDSLPMALGARRKYLVGAPVSSSDPVPLSTVLILGRDVLAEPGGRSQILRGSQAHLSVMEVVHRRRMARLLGTEGRCFLMAAQTASATTVARLFHPYLPTGLASLMDRVEALAME